MKTCLEDVLKKLWRQRKCLLGTSVSNKSKCVFNKSIFDNSKTILTPKFSCLENIFGKILKLLIINVDLNPEITVFLADIDYLFKIQSNHLATLSPTNLENISNFEG